MTYLPVRDLARSVRDGDTTAAAVVSERLAVIDARNPELGALRHVAGPQAQDRARHLDAARGRPGAGGRLEGVPFCVKDSIPVEGMPRSDGSTFGADGASAVSARVVRRLYAEGAVCVGKSNMAEYGKSYFTENPPFGVTRNPFDASRTPGGSGGGDAAAVAAGFASFGLGADAGGSVRVPAAFCGLFGLYPTPGLVGESDMTGTTHPVLALFRSVGVVARTADDVALVLSVVSGPDVLDPRSSPRYDTDPPDRPLGPTGRFGWSDRAGGTAADRRIGDAVRRAVSLLTSAGLVPHEGLPDPIAAAAEPFVLLGGQAALVVEDLLAREAGTPRDPGSEGRRMRGLRAAVAAALPPPTAESTLRSLHRVHALREAALASFADVDFLVTPVAACLPPHVDADRAEIEVGGGATALPFHEAFRFAAASNVLGLPSLAVPAGTADGLPVSVQLIGPRFSERRLLAAAALLSWAGLA